MPRSGCFKSKRYSYFIIICLAIMITAAGACFIFSGRPPDYYLSVYDARTGERLVTVPAGLEDRLTLSYTHSADGTPVYSVFSLSPEGLSLVEESYSWYGAGLEAGSGYDFAFNENLVLVSGYERLFEQLPLRVARTVSQELIIGDKTLLLEELAPGGTLLILLVEK